MSRIALAFTFLFCMMLNASAGGFGDGFGAGSGTFLGGTVPNATTFSGNVRIDGTLDQRGAISNGGSATCYTGLTGVPCFADNIGINTGSDSFMYARAGTTAAQAGMALINSSNASMGGLRYWGSTFSLAALQNRVGLFSEGGAVETIIGEVTSDRAAGTVVTRFVDGSGGANTLATLDGAGNLSLAAGATRSKGTITLAAGTGTATVTSGCVPSCVDTTAVAAVRCVVATTTLTATGTGTDVIAYLCL